MEGLESMQRRKIKKRKAYFEYSKNMNRKYDILKGKPIRLLSFVCVIPNDKNV